MRPQAIAGIVRFRKRGRLGFDAIFEQIDVIERHSISWPLGQKYREFKGIRRFLGLGQF